jgi:signal transduction histidine kinase
VGAAARPRRRLERDLHDGAQQRLMAIQVKLRLARRRATGEALAEELEAVGVDAAEAVDELRNLAHGIYPPVLRDRGLADAIRSVAMTAPIAIDVTDQGVGRCLAATEAAIYFCACEAIQNTIKHAGSNAHVTVTLGRQRGAIHFAITDEGVGMDVAATSDATGLVGMRDRIGAIGGELEITSSVGLGTSVRGTAPNTGPESGLEESGGTP